MPRVVSLKPLSCFHIWLGVKQQPAEERCRAASGVAALPREKPFSYGIVPTAFRQRQVVEDEDHASVVETLQSLRESEPSLLVVVLDALGNLSLPASLLGDITANALGLLESAEPATLPVLVRERRLFLYYGRDNLFTLDGCV